MICILSKLSLSFNRQLCFPFLFLSIKGNNFFCRLSCARTLHYQQSYDYR
ncbi:hypothetical protein Hanom_Chr07g00597621 [Helianthus anomalus]